MKGRQIENVEVKVSVENFAKELELEVVERGRGEIVLKSISVSRPGLQLSGYFKHFEKTRVQVIGNAENEYLIGLSKEKRYSAFENLIMSIDFYLDDILNVPGAIADRLTYLFEVKKIEKAAFARQIGSGRTTIHRYLSGESTPTKKKLLIIIWIIITIT